MNKIKTVKIKNQDGSIDENTYFVSANAKLIDMENGKDLQETIGTINIDRDGDIATQLKNMQNSFNNSFNILNTDILKKIYYYKTLEDMLNDVKLKNGDIVLVIGHYNFEDGGIAYYQITDDSTLIIDNGSVYELKNHLKAKLIVLNNEVCYNQFGAYGDGIHDDYEAIYKTHNYANLHGCKVVGCGQSTYYVKDIKSIINIKTNVDFKNATFIIDDRGIITKVNLSLFQVISNFSNFSKTGVISTLTPEQDFIPELAGNNDCLVKVINSHKKDFIRKGLNANLGTDRTDIFRIDNSGNILDKIVWDFDEITSIFLYPIDKTILTIENGNFITKVNNYNDTAYFARDIKITRSNVIVNNIKHTIEDEDITSGSCPYSGFIRTELCTNVTIKNCLLSAHKTYYKSNGAAKGSYDLHSEYCININYENIQSVTNITDKSLWGMHASNGCKKLTFKNCILNRIDAHRGVWDIDIDNCIIGSSYISLIGGGIANISNTKVIDSPYFIYLREDYGAFWNGTINIKNCELTDKQTGTATPSIIRSTNTYDHDFGYVCYMPDIYIDGFKYNYTHIAHCGILVTSYLPNPNVDYTKTYAENANNGSYPVVFAKHITVKNMTVNLPNIARFVLIAIGDINYYYSDILSDAIDTDYSSLKKNYKYNCFIDVDNVWFGNRINENYSTGNCTLFEGSFVAGDFHNTYRVIPKINIKNCNYLILAAQGRPIEFNIDNCDIYRLRCGNNGSWAFFNIKNSNIHYYYANNASPNDAKAFVVAPKCYKLENVKFLLDNKTLNDIVSIECPFLDIENTNSFVRIHGIYKNNMFWETFPTEFAETQKYQYLIMNSDFNIGMIYNNDNLHTSIPYNKGTTSQRPEDDSRYLEKHLPIGFNYFDTTLNKLIQWDGFRWKE